MFLIVAQMKWATLTWFMCFMLNNLCSTVNHTYSTPPHSLQGASVLFDVMHLIILFLQGDRTVLSVYFSDRRNWHFPFDEVRFDIQRSFSSSAQLRLIKLVGISRFRITDGTSGLQNWPQGPVQGSQSDYCSHDRRVKSSLKHSNYQNIYLSLQKEIQADCYCLSSSLWDEWNHEISEIREARRVWKRTERGR